jgi:hypothetical protein
MLNPSILLAAIETPDIDMLRQGQKGSNPQIFGTDITVVLAVALGLAAILFFWVFFIRPKPTHARGSLVVSRVDKKSKAVHPVQAVAAVAGAIIRRAGVAIRH